MSVSRLLVIAALDDQRFALPLSAVDRIVRAVEVTPLPNSPPMAVGVINVQGRIVPAVDIRKRFGLPPREMELSDQLIIAHTSRRTVALIVDAVSDVLEGAEQDVIAAGSILPNLESVEGVIKVGDDLVPIHNLDRLLSLEDERTLGDMIDREQVPAQASS